MQTELKLNIGCFNNPVDGWINIDITLHTIIAKFPLFRELLYKFRILSPERYKEHLEGKFDNILRYDIRKGLPFPDGCCIYIYSSHFIEHLFYPEVEKFFMECYRVLCKGGVVRTVVPDFYNYVQKYMNFRKENVGNIILEDCLNDDKFLEEQANFLLPFFRNTYETNKERFLRYGHKSLWDEISLAYVLKKNGFRNIRLCNFHQGKMPDLEKLENRVSGSIYMEAEK